MPLVTLFQTLLATHFDPGGTLFINQKPDIWNCVTFKDINGGKQQNQKQTTKKHKQTSLTDVRILLSLLKNYV